MKCSDCVFYSGIQCHGHGDFWGSCGLIDLFVHSNHLDYHDYDVWSDVCDDDDDCKFSELLKLK